MIRQLFNKLTQALKSAPAPKPQVKVAATLMAAALTQPRQYKSKRVKSGAGRLFRSYRPLKGA